MNKYKDELIKLLEKEANSTIELAVPPDKTMGDYSLQCFSLAKEQKKNPVQLASELKEKIKASFLEKIETKGPYLNFFIKSEVIIKDTLEDIRKKKDLYGSSLAGKGKTALVEHTSINPNASPHVGRARNALIGDAVVRLLRFEGYKTDVHYFVNDVGKQIAMLLLGAEGKKSVTFKDLLSIYVEINKKVEENPELEKDVFALLNKLENGDNEIREKFRKIVDTCIKGQSEILGKLGITYDSYDYESEYLWNKRTSEILDEFKKAGKLTEDEEHRLVLNQEEYKLPTKAPYLVLTRADKTSLYPLRDIAYTVDKIKTNSDKNIIVLGEDQKLYFQQLKAALDILGYIAPEVIHYSFVLLSDGKMSTRKGNVVLLEDFMKEAVEKAREEIKKRHDLVDEKTADSIAYGAVKYAILKVSNEKNVTFDWDIALSFEGESGPYLQYSYARICSIFRKYGQELPTHVDLSLLKEESEIDLIKYLAQFESSVSQSVRELSPHIIANYAYTLTKKFSDFYHKCPVLNTDDEELKKARLVLISAVQQVIKNALFLIGIDVIEKM